ncbi:hypothetical protein UK23_08620 [Lentzea aerocolonigenes]|uniref:MucB/RseB N-terminal domain-containing protein n=1 Tax=Lentzea aerocolonigenes TaxID=68170 RepID=A0A0F0H854_LENAE|nr:hypothetical protein [Lentzea aerocolonigenes]KJK51031.1 hypothetical protein UK23_08620 [Lentzea aerocolonigenes]
MVSENELLDDVRAVLHAEVEGVTANSAALLASVKRKKTVRWPWLVLPVVAAAAAAAVLVPQQQQPEAAPVEVAYQLERTNAALEGVRGMVIHEQAPSDEKEKYFRPGEKGLSERWHAADGSAFRYQASVDGRPIVDLSRSAAGDIFVDHRARTYRSTPGETPDDQVWTPEEIQKAIRDGRITVAGPSEPINGTPAVRLDISADKAGVATEMWVDAATYLPMRWRWVQDGGTPFDVTWLPPTPENLAALKTQIPDGFTRVG